jgi:hypothetical protein
MKKIFMTLSAGTTLALAIALGSCNNAEQVKKQVDEQNAKIQSMVDEQLNAAKAEADAACTARIDSSANAEFAAWKEAEAKNAKKGGKKPAPKPKETKKDEPKKDDKKVDVGQKNADDKKIDVGQKGTGGKKLDVGQKKQ